MPRFEQAHVFVAGDVMLDRYWHGEAQRISPEAPVPVLRVERREDRPGGAANVAVNVAALGAAASLAGLVGRDEAAAALRALLDEAGVRHALVEAAREPTILKLRVIGRNQQMIRLDHEERFSADHAALLQRQAEALAVKARVAVLSDYGKGTLADAQGFIAAARRGGRPALVDPKGVEFGRYRGAMLLKPNLAEFELVAGPCRSEAELIAKGNALIERVGLEAMLVTRGTQGMTLLQRHGGATHFPARMREVYDVTGAGDTVIATVAAALAAGETLLDAVALSNVAAGLAVGRLGTAAIGGGELRAAIGREARSGRGVMAEEPLLAAIAEARAAGERIVFTNGCFDMLHAGHVRILEEAKGLGDRLVVALNSDASVRRLKGAGRPVTPLEQRMAVIAAIAAVDWVVAFDEDTPIPLLKKIRPEVLAKGGDYSLDAVVGAEIVKAYGGEVRVLAHVEGVSTTAVLRRLKDLDGCG